MKSVKIKRLRDLDKLPEDEWVKVSGGKLNVRLVRKKGDLSEKDRALADFFDSPVNVRDLFEDVTLRESKDEVVIRIPKRLLQLESKDKLNVVVEDDKVVIERA